MDTFGQIEKKAVNPDCAMHNFKEINMTYLGSIMMNLRI